MPSPTYSFPEGKLRGRTGPQGAAGSSNNTKGPAGAKGPNGTRVMNSVYIVRADRGDDADWYDDGQGNTGWTYRTKWFRFTKNDGSYFDLNFMTTYINNAFAGYPP